MNILLLVIDSLRGVSLDARADRPVTPFFDRLSEEATYFSRAYSTECWTLPSHVSMFTGLLPSAHGAHFQSMAYEGTAPTMAELLAKAGFRTEVITRNPVLDGTVPGVLRGFQTIRRPMAPFPRLSPAPILLALTKPRLRRQIKETGFFHPKQAENAEFVMDFARQMMPADHLALQVVLERLSALHGDGQPFFLFSNLFDVHAPYSPSETSIFESAESWRDLIDIPIALAALAKIGKHSYLQRGFRMSERGRSLLLKRYHRAIELMDAKLAAFFRECESHDLLRDTLTIVTSDHGEAFGEKELYLHDASVYEPNVRVPLWILQPDRKQERIDDVVSLSALFELIRCSAFCSDGATLLDENYRAQNPVAICEHFYYPRVSDMNPKYRVNQVAAVSRSQRVVLRGSEAIVESQLGLEAARYPAENIDAALACLPGETQNGSRSHLKDFQNRFG